MSASEDERLKQLKEQIQSPQTVGADNRADLDQGSDESYLNPERYQPDHQLSRSQTVQGIHTAQSVMSLGDNSPAMNQVVQIDLGTRVVAMPFGVYKPEQLLNVVDPHEPVANFNRLYDWLRDHHVAVIRFRAGFGRRATAVHVLWRLLGDKEIAQVDVEAEVALDRLAPTTLFAAGRGYVLEYSGPIRENTLRTLEGAAAAGGSKLVILALPFKAGDEEIDGYEFVHEPVAPREVLRVHLRQRIRAHECAQPCTEQDKDRLIQKRMQDIDTLEGYTLPTSRWSLVRLAVRLAESVHSDTPTGELVRLDTSELRELAKRALSVDDDSGAADASRRLSFRLAYAVFNECSLGDVLHTGEFFEQKVLPGYEQRERTPDRVAFDGRIEELIDRAMWDETAVGTDSGPRRSRLTDPKLTHSFLDVVWNDFDSLREPLMLWLYWYAGDARPLVQIRAAHAVSILATFDFDDVYRRIIGRWARDTLVYRRSAAHALDAASERVDLRDRIRRQVGDWARSPDVRLRDSAARAYGLLVGKIEVEDAIRALRALGSSEALFGSTAIATSVVLLFIQDPAAVVQELASWHKGPSALRRHGARAVSLLVKLAGPKAAENGWPAMTAVMGKDDSLRETIARMWSSALVSTGTAWGAWSPLLRWILTADEASNDTDLVDGIVELGAQVLANAGERARFHLLRWRNDNPESGALRKIEQRLMPQKAGR